MNSLAPAIVLALALAGCTFLAPPSRIDDITDDEEGDHPTIRDGDGPLCGRVTLTTPERVRVGEPIEVEASLANCGNSTLQIDRGLCPDEGSGFRLLVRSGLHEWHLHARDAPEAAALDDTPCARGGTSIFGLPPSRPDVPIAHTVTFRWNGTFSTDPCYPPQIAGGLACLQFAPIAPGQYELRARIGASGVFWEGNATLVVEGDAAPASPPCGRLSLVEEPYPFEPFREFVARIENCGGTFLTLDPALACLEGYPIELRLTRGEEEWMLAHHTAIEIVGCSPVDKERLVPPEGFGWMRTLWDGKIEGEPAPPGTYEVVASVAAREGWSAQARLTIDVV